MKYEKSFFFMFKLAKRKQDKVIEVLFFKRKTQSFRVMTLKLENLQGQDPFTSFFIKNEYIQNNSLQNPEFSVDNNILQYVDHVSNKMAEP